MIIDLFLFFITIFFYKSVADIVFRSLYQVFFKVIVFIALKFLELIWYLIIDFLLLLFNLRKSFCYHWYFLYLLQIVFYYFNCIVVRLLEVNFLLLLRFQFVEIFLFNFNFDSIILEILNCLIQHLKFCLLDISLRF